MKSIPGTELNDKYLRLVGIPVSVFIVLLLQMPVYFPGRWDLFWRYVFISIIFTTIVWEIARLIVIYIRNRFPLLEQTKQRIGWLFLVFVVQLAVMQFLLTYIVLKLGWTETNESFLKVWFINFLSSLFFILIIMGAYEAIYFSKQYKLTIERSALLKKQQAQHQIDALKTRVNPHFLFNSLTTLSALIGEDKSKAERFVDELSKVYRYLLRSARYHTMTLKDEIEFAKSYCFLLENRFSPNEFNLQFKVQSQLLHEKSVPTLTFQNVIDYLIRTQNLPLTIKFEVEDNHLLFHADNHPKKLAFDTPQNDWRQLELHGAKLESDKDYLKINVPFIHTS